MKIGIVAGENSGDFLGAQLIRALRDRFPRAAFTGICGPLMQAEGARSIAPMEKLSIMGFEGLAGSIFEILSIRRKVYRELVTSKPDLFIGIDAPDFNLALESRLRRQGIQTVHYVSPTVWAWRGYRIRKIRRAVDLMLTLFPFEADYYRQNDVPVEFVGHPLAESLEPAMRDDDFRAQFAGDNERLVAVLPGSRVSEIRRLGRVFAETAIRLNSLMPDLRFVVPIASEKVRNEFDSQCQGLETDALVLVEGQSRRALAASDFTILASGTAALEAGLLGTPMIVAYRISALGYWFVRRSLTVKHASMPNHLLASHPVPEFIHDAVTVDNLVEASAAFLQDDDLMGRTGRELARIHGMLQRDSGALATAAIDRLLK